MHAVPMAGQAVAQVSRVLDVIGLAGDTRARLRELPIG